MRIRYLPGARADLQEIRHWIARDNPERALSFVQELRRRIDSLADQPRRFPVVTLDNGSVVHKLTHQHYHIFYRVDGTGVLVIAIRHAARSTSAFD